MQDTLCASPEMGKEGKEGKEEEEEEEEESGANVVEEGNSTSASANATADAQVNTQFY